jgi:hypothetical protein
MIGFIIFIVISLSFWIYTTKINKNFYPNLQNKIVDYINNIAKKVNPLTDNLFNNNIPLMKTNLYLITFYKNIDLYNNIYNSNDFSFLINTENVRNLQFSDFSNLISNELAISDDILKTKLSTSYISNVGFSKFFLDLSNKGVYLLDYWSLFFGLIKPLLIIKSNKYNDSEKKSKLNLLHNTDTYDLDKINKINNNLENIVQILYQSILLLSNITIQYKNIIDLNNLFNNPNNNLNGTDYGNQLNTLNNNLDKYFDQLSTYLKSSSNFEYVYVNSYINQVIGERNKFIKEQNNTNYITLYKMFSNIDNFSVYSQDIDNDILSVAISPNY